MPAITLQIPVNELLVTISQAVAEGRDIRKELIEIALEGNAKDRHIPQ